jgi:hypothetical protein
VLALPLAGKVLHFDLALSDYGPEADKIRAQLKENLAKTIDEVWHPGRRETDADFAAENFKGAIRNLQARETVLGPLHPTTDHEKQALTAATADMDAIGQTRMQMSFALASPVSYPLVIKVVTWAAFLFFGYGLMSKANAVSLIAVLIGALAVASATLLILDLSSPYSGIFSAFRPLRSGMCWRSLETSRVPALPDALSPGPGGAGCRAAGSAATRLLLFLRAPS